MTLPDRIKKLAARQTGMCTADIATRNAAVVGVTCARLVERGELFRVKLHRRHVRFFTDPLLADALRLRVEGRVNTIQAAERVDHVRRAQWSDDAPIAGYAPDFKFVRLPGFVAPRFQEHVLPFVHGGLRCA